MEQPAEQSGLPVSDEAWALLQDLARKHERGDVDAAGFVRYVPAHDPLVWLGLVEQGETVAGLMRLRLTDFGWQLLSDGLERVDG